MRRWWLGLLGCACVLPVHAADATGGSALGAALAPPHRADFVSAQPSPQARYVADWVVDAGDNQRLPFALVDKVAAQVFVFDANGRLLGTAPVLLGLAVGDDAVPGIGQRKLSSIRPEERTTPAGRFVAALDRNLHGAEVLWVDYEGAISMHPVITNNAKEQRAERLATATPQDNRISYGCINVPVAFYKNVVHPAFAGTHGIVYVLPETRTPQQVFAAYDVTARHALTRTAAPPPPALSDLAQATARALVPGGFDLGPGSNAGAAATPHAGSHR
jgi:hypothetical protein